MKKLLALFFVSLLCSCQYFDKQVPDEEELLQKRLDEINWKEVSTYPSIPECDSILDKEEKKKCFFSSMTRLVQERLTVDSVTTSVSQVDTIMVKVTVFPNATLKFEPQFLSDSVTYNQIRIDSILNARLADFPRVEPAQKEGVPVKTQFILPVILNVE